MDRKEIELIQVDRVLFGESIHLVVKEKIKKEHHKKGKTKYLIINI